MVELDGARRRLNRAVYTPIVTQGHSLTHSLVRGSRGRALDKVAVVSGFNVRLSELEPLRSRIRAAQGPDSLARLVDLAEEIIGREGNGGAAAYLTTLPQFAEVKADDIVAFGQHLIAVRSERADAAGKAINSIERHLQHELKRVPEQAITAPRLRDMKVDESFFSSSLPGAKLYRKESTETVRPTSPAAKAAARRAAPSRAAERDESSGAITVAATEAPQQVADEVTVQTAQYYLELPSAVPPSPITLESLPVTIGTLASPGALPAEPARALRAMANELGLLPGKADYPLSALSDAVKGQQQLVSDLLFIFTRRLEIEPVGYLHLEQLTFTPVGIERGELVHSVPLSPGEEVNIAHREWSNTSEEFERIVTDYLENYSEEGVTEKAELSQAVSAQQQHSSGLNMSVSASGGFGPVSLSTSVGYNVADSSNRSEQTSRNESSELTRKASARATKEHKTSFRVASAAGTEDQAVQKITNPFSDHATRVDYYQLLRRWRVDMYRYGVRLTYDITIPEPGSDVLSKVFEIRSLEAALAQGFNAPGTTLDWAKFQLTPQQVTRQTYEPLAALYGVAAEVPPPDTIRIVKAFSRAWATYDESCHPEITACSVDVSDDYVVTGADTKLINWGWKDKDSGVPILETNPSDWIGSSGPVTTNVFTVAVSAFSLEVQITAKLNDAVFRAWRMRVWSALQDAAKTRYEEYRTSLKSRLSQLQEELGAQDALTLRQMEREEVMKGVLRWMFGPTFEFLPTGMPANLYGPSGSILTADIWAKMSVQGEIIKFLHHAVEWENMLYFLYPYFWSHTSRWDLKKYLDHPDFMHRTFLRAGSARVVLTIRPGFEQAFLSFIENGKPDESLSQPYLRIAEEFEEFAKTNYPGIQAANPVEGARPLLTPLQKRTWDDMQQIIAALEAHKVTHGRYPTTAEGLSVLQLSLPDVDSWGNPYHYRSPGQFADFELVSLGSDGAAGGTGDAADITSWAEASLIGRWYEYAPTSALDISFNDTLPTA